MLLTGGRDRSKSLKRSSWEGDSERHSCLQGFAESDATPLHQISALHHPLEVCVCRGWGGNLCEIKNVVAVYFSRLLGNYKYHQLLATNMCLRHAPRFVEKI